MISDANREKIGLWIAGAPELRRVESTETHRGWESAASEDGETVYEEYRWAAPELDGGLV
jgi:hypothetical protein